MRYIKSYEEVGDTVHFSPQGTVICVKLFGHGSLAWAKQVSSDWDTGSYTLGNSYNIYKQVGELEYPEEEDLFYIMDNNSNLHSIYRLNDTEYTFLKNAKERKTFFTSDIEGYNKKKVIKQFDL